MGNGLIRGILGATAATAFFCAVGQKTLQASDKADATAARIVKLAPDRQKQVEHLENVRKFSVFTYRDTLARLENHVKDSILIDSLKNLADANKCIVKGRK